VTDKLKQTIQSNPVLRAGFSHQDCMSALELMKSNPTEAKRIYGIVRLSTILSFLLTFLLSLGSNHLVNEFLTEFSRVMGDHFSSIGECANISSNPSSLNSSIKLQEDKRKIIDLK